MEEAEETGVASTLAGPETPRESATRVTLRRIVTGILGASFMRRFPGVVVAPKDEIVRSIVQEATGREPDLAAIQQIDWQLANAR